jgi:hypothetical protein
MDGLLGVIVKLFFPGLSDENSSVFEGVVKNLSTMPLPDFASPDFRSQYAIMWGLGIVISLVTGFFSAAFALGKSTTSIGSTFSVATRMTFFIQTTVIGFFATPILYIITYMANVGGNASLLVTSQNKDGSWANAIVKMFNPDSGLDFILKEVFVWLINHQVGVTQLAIPIMVMCTSGAFAFSILGGPGKAIWRIWWAVTLTLIFVKPTLMWIFALSAKILSSAPNSGDTSFSLIALFVASLLPLVLLYIFHKKVEPPVHPIMLSSNAPATEHSGGQTQGSYAKRIAAAGVATAGVGLAVAAAKHAEEPEESAGSTAKAPRTPGSRRVAVASLTRSTAAKLSAAHPLGAAALTLGSMAINQSGKRAAIKKGPGAVNAAPAPQQSPPAGNPYARTKTSGSSSPQKPNGPNVSPTPARAPHELPTKRPSLGRVNKRR